MTEYNFTNITIPNFNYEVKTITDLEYIKEYCGRLTSTFPMYTFIAFFILSAIILYMNRKNKEGLHIDMLCMIIMLFSTINVIIQYQIK